MILLLALLAAQEPAPDARILVPGFNVRELPARLPNCTNVEYAPDGRLFAAGYDGRLHLLRDRDGDGLEETVTTIVEKPTPDFILGMAFHAGDLYVLRRHAVLRHRDTDGDGVPDAVETAATGWRDPDVDKDPLYQHRRVDDALGLAIGPDGAFYVSIGAANPFNPYLQEDKGRGAPRIDLAKRRGVVLRIPKEGGAPEIVVTGVRYLVGLGFNRHGDLFATDQEGATWCPNGNPFDEFLHLRKGRHYGFPPRHPLHLPGVIDEPSLFDYEPQHQSTCGFRFNERGFGPREWEGDALVTAMTRGKLYRTTAVPSAAGYVARTQLIACLRVLSVDVATAPDGAIVLACHTGAPDWGSGPTGPGKLLKVSWNPKAAPLPLLAWAASPTETAVAYDRPVDAAAWKEAAKRVIVEAGPYVAAGDRFETIRPGYQVVKDQMNAPRARLPVLSAAISPDGRTVLLRTAARTSAVRCGLALPDSDLAHDLTGVEAAWTGGGASWTGWLPHPDLAVARRLTLGSAEHAKLWARVGTPGTLALRFQLDLARMLYPAVQPGSKAPFEPPAETVTVTFAGSLSKRLELAGGGWTPVEISLPTGPGASLDVSWHTNEDPRPRAFPLRRVLLPWARRADAPAPPREIPEIAGADLEAGRKIYFGAAAACHKCHAVRGEGGRLGPDLTNLVHRDYASVLKDVLEPGAAINPDHVGYVARLRNGDVVSGVIAGEADGRLSFGTATGEVVVVERSAIESLKPSAVSVMPEGLLKTLSAAELRDLMAFLLTEPPGK
jgi:putative heme-binding domain-containing protein